MKSFYDILGVSDIASDEDIKKAYKQMALKYHPDKSRTRNAEDRFKQIRRAYEVLADNKKREIYDLYGEAGLMIEEGANYDDTTRLEKNYSVSLEEISMTSKPRATSKKRVGPRNEKLSASQEIPTTTRKRRTEKKVAASSRDDSSTATASTVKRKRSKSRTRRKSCDIVDASSKVIAKIKPQSASGDKSSNRSPSQSNQDDVEMKNSSTFKVITIVLLALALINLIKNIIYGLMLLVHVAINVAIVAFLYFLVTGRMTDFYQNWQYFASNFWTMASELMLRIIQIVLRR